MSSKIKYETLKEYYVIHLSQHTNNFNRFLHTIGITFAIFFMFLNFLKGNYLFVLISPLIGNAINLIGHLCFEKNKPATLKNPIFSLLSEFIMVYHILTGQILTKMKENDIENFKYINTNLF